MTTYHLYERGRYGAGTILIRITRESGVDRAVLRTIETVADEEANAVYPSESTTPEKAFRLAENKRQGSPGSEIVVELGPAVEWKPEWGALEGQNAGRPA